MMGKYWKMQGILGVVLVEAMGVSSHPIAIFVDDIDMLC